MLSTFDTYILCKAWLNICRGLGCWNTNRFVVPCLQVNFANKPFQGITYENENIVESLDIKTQIVILVKWLDTS